MQICMPVMLQIKVFNFNFQKQISLAYGAIVNHWIPFDQHKFKILILLCLSNFLFSCWLQLFEDSLSFQIIL